MKNIHTLPTNKPSRLQKNKHNKLFLSEENKSYSDCIIQNIHITNDEEIKEGDYGILGKEVLSYHQMHKKWGMPQGKKIILTTDADLVKDGVQAIPDEFLEWFVKNPSCEEVEVTYGVLKPFQSEDKGYLIHCPDNEVLEEPKQDLEKEMFELEQELDIPSNLRWHNSKPKQETLEEVAERYYEDEVSINAFINGYKLAQEQILDFLYSEITERRDYSASKMCEKIIEFIEQFKNK